MAGTKQDVLNEIADDLSKVENIDRLGCMVVIVKCLNTLSVEIENWKKRIGSLSTFNTNTLPELRSIAKGMAEATFLFLKQTPENLPPPPPVQEIGVEDGETSEELKKDNSKAFLI